MTLSNDKNYQKEPVLYILFLDDFTKEREGALSEYSQTDVREPRKSYPKLTQWYIFG